MDISKDEGREARDALAICLPEKKLMSYLVVK